MRSANEGGGTAYLGDVDEPLARGKQAGHSKLKLDKSDVPNLGKRRREQL